MNKMAMIDLAKLFLASKITAIEFSERICVERRRLYGVKDLSPNILNCGEELFMAAPRLVSKMMMEQLFLPEHPLHS